MSDSISSTCTCGAEFGANSKNAAELWREWRDDHGCPNQSTALGADLEIAEEDAEEFQIGFRYEPDES